MITDNGERSNGVKNWHYLTVKSIPRLLKGLAPNHKGDFYCLNCFHSHRTKERLEKHEEVCKDHDYCYVKMPDEDKKILKYNPGEKSLNVLFITYAGLECLLGKIDTCQNDPRKSFAEKKAVHTPLGYSWVTCCSFDKSKNEWDYYRGKDCMKMFCKNLRNQAMKIRNNTANQ